MRTRKSLSLILYELSWFSLLKILPVYALSVMMICAIKLYTRVDELLRLRFPTLLLGDSLLYSRHLVFMLDKSPIHESTN